MSSMECLLIMQKNWIGKSEGAEVSFTVADKDGKPSSENLLIYTTRADTLFGATYMVIAPEHPMVKKLTTEEQKQAVENYIEQASKKSDLERTDLAKDKTGVFTGSYAVNPVNGKSIPIWISDYILISYGTGAIMAVPAHDDRDWAFAKKFDLPIIKVVASKDEVESLGGCTVLQQAAQDPTSYSELIKKFPAIFTELRECTTADGYTINSGKFTGLETEQTIPSIITWLTENGIGKKAVNYKLRDGF